MTNAIFSEARDKRREMLSAELRTSAEGWFYTSTCISVIRSIIQPRASNDVSELFEYVELLISVLQIARTFRLAVHLEITAP